MYYVYIVRCNDETLYTGITTDVNRRVIEHNSSAGARYTRMRRPVIVVYTSNPFQSRGDALREEWRIKKLKKVEKMKLFRSSSLG